MLDHGILNLPLAKRGNIDRDIDRDIDRYKAAQAKSSELSRKAAVAQFKADKDAANAALLAIIGTDGLIDAKAAKMCVSRNRLLSLLHDWSKWEPKRLIKLRGEWIK
jgi:hypothetical protein